MGQPVPIKEAIERIKAELDIVDLIERSGVRLRQSGRTHTGFCPFHSNTRTPAFAVYPDTQSFYCFSCQAAGSAFDFVMYRDGSTFPEALSLLAEQAGITLAAPTAQEQERDHEHTRLSAITALVARYFHHLLVHHPDAQQARDYLVRRGISDQTRDVFQLGYSLPRQSHLLSYLTSKKGYTPDEVAAAGIAIRGNNGYYDRFRGRLIFPIRNAKGDVVGFGGRALGDVQPKYLNTPQTLLFEKSSILYGLDLARDAIRQQQHVVLVEGYMDVCTLYQHGMRAVVAPLGTALSRRQAAALQRLTRQVYLALDADSAGSKATHRSIAQLTAPPDGQGDPDDLSPRGRWVGTAQGLVRWTTDLDVRVMALPSGHDPASLLLEQPESWDACLNDALPLVDFLVEQQLATVMPSQPQSMRTALNTLVPLLQQLDTTQQAVYIHAIERRLGTTSGLVADLVRARRAGHTDPPRTRPEATVADRPPGSDLDREGHLLAILLTVPAGRARIQQWLHSQWAEDREAAVEYLGTTIGSLFQSGLHRAIIEEWAAAGYPAAAADDDQCSRDWCATHFTSITCGEVHHILQKTTPHHTAMNPDQALQLAQQLRQIQTDAAIRQFATQDDHAGCSHQERLQSHLLAYKRWVSYPAWAGANVFRDIGARKVM